MPIRAAERRIRRWLMRLSSCGDSVVPKKTVEASAGGAATGNRLTDHLTGLPDRCLLLDHLEHALDRLSRQGRPIAVLFVDLDGFKAINDRLGHRAGDEFLLTIARRMAGTVRARDTVARFGGDEFVVLMDDVASDDDALQLAGRLREAIMEPVVVDGNEIFGSASIGVAVAQLAGTTAESILHEADAAMYFAKQRRSGCCLFDRGMRTRAQNRAKMEAELHRALDQDQLRIHYQPIAGLDGQPVGVEALVRWYHPTRGLVPPAAFLSVAERTGDVVSIGDWVLREACRQIVQWRRRPGMERLSLAVNLSAREIIDRSLPTKISAALDAGLDADGLCLELTETALMADPEASLRLLGELRRIGVRIAVDNFGTGDSSLLQLRRFPAQILKLDRFFVAGLGRSREDELIVGSVISLAHSLGLMAAAQGVETTEQLDVLRELGCDLAQGYVWSPPVPPAEAAPLLGGTLSGPARPPSRSDVRRARTRPLRDRKTVVVVDDSPAERSLVRSIVEGSGKFSVVAEAADGASGIGVVAEYRPNIVILDLSMPGLSGLDALGRIVSAAPGSKVVVFSGFISPAVADAARQAGAVCSLDKAIPPQSLIEELIRVDEGPAAVLASRC